MPRERKKRGRRAATPELASQEHHGSHEHKRRRLSDTLPSSQDAEYEDDPPFATTDRPFYGVLDSEEQEYFKRADDMLEVNNFSDSEEKELFLANVYKEAAGKELKLACSQSCSRLLERLILASNPGQLKNLFQKFSGQFLNLVQHRFASHCCETLFIQAAPVVTQELLADTTVPIIQNDSANIVASMENLFLFAINELKESFGFLMTHNFASHTLRVILTVLSGQSLDQSSPRSILRSRKKQVVEIDQPVERREEVLNSRSIPDSFTSLLENVISDSVASLESNQLWSMATHPTGNPTLQLLLQLELTKMKSKLKENTSIMHRLIPSEDLSEGSESASFVNGLLYDPIGSRLMETVVEYAPGSVFKRIYRQCLKERMGSLARNEVAGYVVCKVLNRLGADDLESAMDSIVPHMSNLAERGRTNVMKSLVERCYARNVDTKPIKAGLIAAYSKNDGSGFSIQKLLQLPSDLPDKDADANLNGSHIPQQTSASTSPPSSTPSQHHASLLAQAMLTQKSYLSELILESLTPLPSETILHIAQSTALSPLLQAALVSPQASAIVRRKLITRLYGHIAFLALTPAGSRLVDAIQEGTQGMAFARERVAEELAEAEVQLRESQYGRKVWRNWRMDLYKRRYTEWVRMTRREAGNGAFQSFPDVDAGESSKENNVTRKSNTGGIHQDPFRKKTTSPKHHTRSASEAERTNGKTPLELARQKYAKINKQQTTQMQAQSQRLHGKGESRRTGDATVHPPATS